MVRVCNRSQQTHARAVNVAYAIPVFPSTADSFLPSPLQDAGPLARSGAAPRPTCLEHTRCARGACAHAPAQPPTASSPSARRTPRSCPPPGSPPLGHCTGPARRDMQQSSAGTTACLLSPRCVREAHCVVSLTLCPWWPTPFGGLPTPLPHPLGGRPCC